MHRIFPRRSSIISLFNDDHFTNAIVAVDKKKRPLIIQFSISSTTQLVLLDLRLGFMKCANSSIGSGNMMVEFFSADIVLNVCRYRSWRADEDLLMTSDASLSACAAWFSPSAAITCNALQGIISNLHRAHAVRRQDSAPARMHVS